jgi:hypothetical protein
MHANIHELKQNFANILAKNFAIITNTVMTFPYNYNYYKKPKCKTWQQHVTKIVSVSYVTCATQRPFLRELFDDVRLFRQIFTKTFVKIFDFANFSRKYLFLLLLVFANYV